MQLNKIYNCDFKDFIKENGFKSINLICTDPPYNIGFKYNEHNDNMSDMDYTMMLKYFSGKASVFIHYPEETIKYLTPALGVPCEMVAWVYNANTNRKFRLISWYNCKPDFSKIKQPYKNINDKRIQNRIANGCEGSDLYDWWEINIVKNVSDEKTEHPCQIPLQIMERIILLTTEKGDTIFDPFMGSATTAIACLKTGRNFIGCEKDKKYFKIGMDRIEEYERQERIDLCQN